MYFFVLLNRELAQQTRKVVIALGDYMGAQCHACIGGTSVKEDMRKLEAGQHIVVGESQHFFNHLLVKLSLRTSSTNIRLIQVMFLKGSFQHSCKSGRIYAKG